jgi:hypothetical protein
VLVKASFRLINTKFQLVFAFIIQGGYRKLKDLIPLPPHKAIPPIKKKPVHLINRKLCEKEIKNKEAVYLLFTKEIEKSVAIPPEMSQLLHQYQDVFPDDLPKGLPPIRGIEHQIDLYQGHLYQINQPIRPIQLKQKSCKDKWKSYYKEGM